MSMFNKHYYIILGRREIRELPVKCDNMERGCQRVGTVGTLEEHVSVCQFTLVPCPKECKDDNGILKIMRRDLQQHLEEQTEITHVNIVA